MKLPGGQMATVMYRVGADAEMRKVVDKVVNNSISHCVLYIVFTTYHQVADKLGKPASRVRLCIGGSSALGSGIVGESSIVGSRSGASSILSFDGGRTSESVSNMALVEGGSLAVRFSALSVLHTL